jgi:hypothetical protein
MVLEERKGRHKDRQKTDDFSQRNQKIEIEEFREEDSFHFSAKKGLAFDPLR